MQNKWQFCARMKDYYAILDCTPLSTAIDIKKQYRKLAQQYHPDKNPDDPYAAAIFHDLKEAYETLTQPDKKEAWLNERWLRQVHNQFNPETTPLTPDRILKKLLKLDRQLASVDSFRMDQLSTIKEVEEILNDENLQCLHRFNETEINHTILLYMLSCTKPFEHPYLGELWPKLYALAGSNTDEIAMIDKIKQQKYQKHIREKWTAPIVILITILLCLMIYTLAN